MSKAGGGSGWNRLPGNGRCRGLAFSEPQKPNPGSVKDRSNARHSLMLPCSSELNRSWLEVRIVDDKTGEPIAAAVVDYRWRRKGCRNRRQAPARGLSGKASMLCRRRLFTRCSCNSSDHRTPPRPGLGRDERSRKNRIAASRTTP